MKNNNHIIEISYVRVLAMLMIVMFHCLCLSAGVWNHQFQIEPLKTHRILANFLNTFDLPFFFFVSGYLYAFLLIHQKKYKNTYQFLITKTQRLLIPYIIWGTMHLYLFPNLCKPINLVSGICHLWFLLTLFFLFLVSTLFHHCKSTFVIDIIILIILIVSLEWILHNLYLPLFLRQACRYAPFFMIGFIYKKYNYTTIIATWHGWIVGMGAIILVCLVEYLIVARINNALVLVFLISSTTIMLLEIFRRCSYKFSTRIEETVTNLDKNSMGIYILHHIIIWGLLSIKSFLTFFQNNTMFAPIILFVIVFPLSWIMTEFINRFKLSKILFG